MLILKSVNFKKDRLETLIIPVCEDRQIHESKTVTALIAEAEKLREFTGKKNDEIMFYSSPEIKTGRILFLGLGKFKNLTTGSLRELSGRAVKKSIKIKLKNCHIAVPAAGKTGLQADLVLEAMLEGACLGNHIFDKYKYEKKETPLELITLVVPPATAKKFNYLPLQVSAVCSGTIMAREWVSTPSNEKTPAQFARSIMARAGTTGLKISVLDEKKLKQKKFGALLAVAAGSKHRPRLLMLEHKPKNAKKTIALIGKGVTFDSGGINLKPAGALDGMKMDMAGAAAVAATLITASKLNFNHHIIGVLPLVENMPSGSAARPGDVVRTYTGKTVEIGNTDAEGRLILADAMAYAIEAFKPHTVVDMATLTGACVVALGEKIAGVFSPEDALAVAIVESGKKTGERCWHLPLPDDYRELLKSDLADMSNMSSSRWGGAITAALFLSEFAKDTNWAHIDIAGTAMIKKTDAFCTAGGTGFGVRLLLDWLKNL
ncbi:MAG: leucyl aminopeptidase [Desulfobacteraceae bacterium 4572_123]|nr:MAG: leucyl aminopeptidase [Desulfobacteraceae bacterium 4572_123]